MLPKHRPPSHPGEVLKELFLEPAGLAQSDLAKHLGWSKAKINEIVKGKRGITPETALAFSDTFGTTPDVWMGLQTDYDIWYALQSHKTYPRLTEEAS